MLFSKAFQEASKSLLNFFGDLESSQSKLE